MRPDDGRMSLWPLAVVGVIVVLAVASITPVRRLNPAPPSDFVALRSSANRSDASLAAGYWESAESVIQWKYSRTSTLPEEVPADFKLADHNGTGNPAARSAYWAKLREEWLRADNWHTTYSFDASWIVVNVEALSHAVTSFVTDHM